MVGCAPSDLVLYEDEAILVINKPAGLLSLRDGYDKSIPHLSTILTPLYGRIWMVHRLDRETSGVMVVARTAQAHHALNDQFKYRQVVKHYHALVIGNPDWNEKKLEVNLRKDGDRQHRTTIDPKGKPSETYFKVIERFGDVSLIQASPHTGYTHQIRTHLAYLGYPLVGDGLYGKPLVNLTPIEPPDPDLPPIGRVALHALSITFVHPLTLANPTFSSAYPQDFSNALQGLRLKEVR